jgi:hypothetical protein
VGRGLCLKCLLPRVSTATASVPAEPTLDELRDIHGQTRLAPGNYQILKKLDAADGRNLSGATTALASDRGDQAFYLTTLIPRHANASLHPLLEIGMFFLARPISPCTRA